MRKLRTALIAIAAVVLAAPLGCSRNESKGPVVEYYEPAYRQLPPEPVYSRVGWSHLSGPIKPRVRQDAPLLMPVMAFELPRSTVGEAIEALAQAIGYSWSYPPEAAGRRIAIKMTAPIDEILREIGRQGGVYGVLDHEERRIRVVSKSLLEAN